MVDLIAQSMLACLVATFVTCETAGRWAFMFWSAAMFFTISGVFTLTPPLIFALYGSKHFRVNVGLMDMSGVVGAVLTVVVVPILKDAFGWHGMFYVGFAGLFASMLLNMSMSLKIGDSIPDHMRPILSL
ncbi:hypothetical protein V1264_002191 [Littorina saxatilis]|uniref:Uncharacterized protein n=2 Tax=Littorina saxatilis TaxID=31220 RepID=A0AAN9GPZ8_9CAEN